MKTSLLSLALLLPAAGFAQSFSIDWHKVAGGGGTITGGTFAVSGTIGQPDASGTMSGGNFSVTGGFWSLINVVQTPGAPTLYISHAGTTVTVFWQNTGTWTLQQNGNLTVPAGWNNSGGITTAGGTNFLVIPHPAGNQFFRLK
ncbi:MAG: hypothetical protein P4N60_15560 [Verrucomicrobiae bacterium]|nr:hypothetical protein [Verrucomicrobiae bacterium]